MKRKRAIIDSQNIEDDAVERLIYNGVPSSISKPTLDVSHLRSIDEDGELGLLSSQGETSITNCSQDINMLNPNISSVSNNLPLGSSDTSISLNNVNATIISSTINSSVVTDNADVTLTNESLNESNLTDVGNTTAVLSYNTRTSSSSSSGVVRISSNSNSKNDAPLTRTALKKRKVIQDEEMRQQQLQQKQLLFSSPMKVRSKAQQLTDSASKALVQLKNSPVSMK